MGHIVLERLDRLDLPAVQALLLACGEPLVTASGCRTAAEVAQALFGCRPDGVSPVDKHVLGVCDPATRELMGVVEAIAGYPDPSTLTLGLFVLSPFHADGPLRDDVQQQVEVWAARRGHRRLRIAIHAISLALLDSWRKAGFTPEGDPIRDGRRLVVVFEKRLSSGGPESATPLRRPL